MQRRALAYRALDIRVATSDGIHERVSPQRLLLVVTTLLSRALGELNASASEVESII